MAACGASAACGGFGFPARNTAATFDVFYWLQVTNFDVLLNSAPSGPDYIDIWDFWIQNGNPLLNYPRSGLIGEADAYWTAASLSAPPKPAAGADARAISGRAVLQFGFSISQDKHPGPGTFKSIRVRWKRRPEIRSSYSSSN
ncbi:MAG: hypothetical protein DME87_12130 [Verrucomicrobia bacterium]|nr:MAG: hypothetical protein DME87_12130 [Verrucomicrobiota bacterium]